MKVIAQAGKRELTIEVVRRAGVTSVHIDGRDAKIESIGRDGLRAVTVDGRTYEAAVWPSSGAEGAPRGVRGFDVAIAGRIVPVRLVDPLRHGNGRVEDAAGDEGAVEIRAVMPGKVTAVLKAPGDEVEAGTGLLVIEAMKMENEIPAPRSGRIASVLKAPGEAVEAGALLVVLEPR
jgi:biotin carboxyl carrier protein